jgi:hypothetical protein
MTVRTSYRLVHNQILMRCTITTHNHINVQTIMMRLLPKYYAVTILEGVEAWWVL